MSKRHTITLSLDRAAEEFDIDRRTLAKLFSSAEIQPASPDGYTLLQVHRAIAGDLEAEKIRSERAKADLLEIELAEKRGSVVEVETVKELGAKVMLAVRQKILNSAHLLPEEKDELLNEIARLGAEDFRCGK